MQQLRQLAVLKEAIERLYTRTEVLTVIYALNYTNMECLYIHMTAAILKHVAMHVVEYREVQDCLVMRRLMFG